MSESRIEPGEAEIYVESLRIFDVQDIGGNAWMRQHEYLEKLNIQAILNASADEDEFIKSFIVSFEKVPVLITDLLATEVWKEKIFTELLEMKFEPKTTFPLYMVFYHEATLVNLFETTLFYPEMCESADDSLLDLVDYCYRKLVDLVNRHENKEDFMQYFKENPSEGNSNMEDLQRQSKHLEFEMAVKTISILRYITDNLEGLCLSVQSRLLNTHDLPVLLVQLVENPPWTSRSKGKVFKYFDCKWHEMKSREDEFKLTKPEGQVWIALFHLLMNHGCQQKYSLNSYRKNTILKLRSYLTEVLVDQMPILLELQRYLEYLAHMEPPAVKKDLILEQVPQIKDNILKKAGGKWKQIAVKQANSYFTPSDETIKTQAKRWAETYNLDVLDELIKEPPLCAVCHQVANKRCSRCRNEWYCRRQCQVSHWPKHKTVCDVVANDAQSPSLRV